MLAEVTGVIEVEVVGYGHSEEQRQQDASRNVNRRQNFVQVKPIPFSGIRVLRVTPVGEIEPGYAEPEESTPEEEKD